MWQWPRKSTLVVQVRGSQMLLEQEGIAAIQNALFAQSSALPRGKIRPLDLLGWQHSVMFTFSSFQWQLGKGHCG
jgi:hypothetical protein